MIVSFNPKGGQQLEIAATSRALISWAALAAGAERKIPTLYLGMRKLGLNDTLMTEEKRLFDKTQEITKTALEKHYEFLGLHKVAKVHGGFVIEQADLKRALKDVMFLVNWLSMLPIS